jgi:hypothetical protein
MEFFLLVLLNIFMAALFYLIISLKLERSATSFREQRLRKEMDEIIREFNAAAERNISLLEDRINRYRQLLKRAGDYEGLDLLVSEQEVEKEPASKKKRGSAEGREYTAEMHAPVQPVQVENQHNEPQKAKGITLTDLLSFAGEKIREAADLTAEKIRKTKKTADRKRQLHISRPVESAAVSEAPAVFETVMSTVPVQQDSLAVPVPEQSVSSKIEKSFEEILPEIIAGGYTPEDAGQSGPTEEEILDIIKSAGDRFSLVSNLAERGLSPEDISAYSGIPEGEIKLIFNLNGGL